MSKKKSKKKNNKKQITNQPVNKTKDVKVVETVNTEVKKDTKTDNKKFKIDKSVIGFILVIVLLIAGAFVLESNKTTPADFVKNTEITDPTEYVEDFKYKKIKVNDIEQNTYTMFDVENKIDEHIKSTVEELKDVKTEITNKTPFSFSGDLVVGKKKYPVGEELMKMEYVDMDPQIRNAFLGKKKGDKVSFEATVTDDDGKPIAGTCKVKITAVKEDPRNYYDNKWVETKQEVYDDCKTTKKFRKLVEEDLARDCEIAINEQVFAKLLKEFEKTVKFKKEPTKLIEKEVNSTYEMYEMYKEYGVDMKKQIMDEQKLKTDAEYENFIKESATKSVKQRIMIEYIADKENLHATKDEVNADIKEYGLDSTNEEDIQSVRYGIVQERVVEWLVDHTKVSYKVQ